MEYDVLKLSNNHIKNKEFLNNKVEDGWHLISVVQVISNDAAGNPTPHLQAYLQREVKKDPKEEEPKQETLFG